MFALRSRSPCLLAESGPACNPLFDSRSSFYREEFIKCQRCLDRQREFYSDRAIEDVERALVRVISQLDRLCTKADADKIISRLLRQFDIVTGLSSLSDLKHVN